MITLIITLVVLGLAFWAISFLPIAQPFLTMIKVIFIIAAVLVLLQAIGVNTGLPAIRLN